MTVSPNVSHGVFETVLCERFQALSPTLQKAHLPGDALLLSGQSTVQRGTSVVARVLSALLGLPTTGDGVAVSVHMKKDGTAEHWTRRFGQRSFASRMTAGTKTAKGLLVEQFGPLRIYIDLQVHGGELHWKVQRASVWALRLPAWLVPSGDSREFESGGQFHFDVEIRHPLAGLVVHYRGCLSPDR